MTSTRPPSPTRVRKIPAHFGDIMSSQETSLVFPNGFSGLERIVLTANGNLQRIFSAFFNLPIAIEIMKNDLLPASARFEDEPILDDENPAAVLQRFDREVNLRCGQIVVCNAKSHILIRDPEVLDMIANGGVGIGQLFRYLDKLPKFVLHAVGRRNQTWWRKYSLRMRGVECRIRETFPSGMFEDGWLEKANTHVSLVFEPELEEDTVWEFE
ncbi:hypothetical protein BC938DRAFT_474136 [Jimgerdemannia flammicorona]|uniref:Uncharacterized protein n=1 Tax=Jimgerdemannia flammicorona TaxID=994334 RepID=A0A433Q2Y5_9FUNG|nr:hypothetical protein BC938DRAFT_474136 [Jimgerdemannia flammicorona]